MDAGRARAWLRGWLRVYGSLFYAGARTLQARLPDPQGTERPVVVLRVRGRTGLGATFVAVLAGYAKRYAKRLDAVGGQLFISGVDESLMELLERTGQISTDGPFEAIPATEVVGEATEAAEAAGAAWLISHNSG